MRVIIRLVGGVSCKRVHKKSTQLLYNDRLQKQRRLTTCALGATESFLLAGHLYLALEALNKRFHQEIATCIVDAYLCTSVRQLGEHWARLVTWTMNHQRLETHLVAVKQTDC